MGTYSRCLLVSDAKHTKDGDDGSRLTRRARCRKRFDAAHTKAERGSCGESATGPEVAQAVEQAVDSLRAMLENGTTVTCPIETEVRAALTLVGIDRATGTASPSTARADGVAGLFITARRVWPDYIGAYCGKSPESDEVWVCGAGRYEGDWFYPFSDLTCPYGWCPLGVWNYEMTPAEGKVCGGIIADFVEDWFGTSLW